jgi:hypothetical protein
MNLHYETEMNLGKTLSMAAKLLWGVARGHFSMDSLRRLLDVSATAGEIKELYQQFPESRAEFEAWLEKARTLWGDKRAVAVTDHGT